MDHPESKPKDAPERSEDVLDAISAVEAQLSQLKQAAAERRQREAQLSDREQKLLVREKELEDSFEQLKRDLAVIEQERTALQAKREQVDRDADARKAELDKLAEAVHDEQTRVRDAMTRLENLQAEAASRNEKLEARAQQLEQAEARLSDQALKVSARLQEMEQQLAEARQQAEAADARATEAEHAREHDASEIGPAREALAAAQAEAARIAQTIQAQDARIAQLSEQAEAAAHSCEQLKAQLDEKTRELDQADESRKRIEADANQRIEQMGERLERMESTLAQANEQLRSHREHAASLEKRAAELSNQLEQAKTTSPEVGQTDPALQAEVAELRDRAARDQATIRDLQQKLTTATEKIRQFGDVIQNQMAGGDARVSEALQKAVGANESLQRRVGELQKQLATLQADRDRLARSSGAGGGAAHSPAAQLRRQRLHRMRQLLREQSKKVRRASTLLQERFDQCETLLSRRAELAAAHQALQQERDRSVKYRARSSAAGAMLAFTFTIAVLLGLSWVLAEKIHPGTYAASAVISADGGERQLTPDELQEWQNYHESMLADPRFIETLAEMMRQRGMASLGSPGALQQNLDQSLTLQSPRNGELDLEYRAHGSARSERVLDTIAIAIARQGNRTRSRRTDGAMSVVSAQAKAKTDPLDADRLTYAAGIFSSGLLLTLGFGAVVWRKLAREKSQFEHDQELQALLSEARWQDPRIDLDAAHPAEAPAPSPPRKKPRKRS